MLDDFDYTEDTTNTGPRSYAQDFKNASMTQTCKQCSAGFEITDSDLAFYEKVSPEFNGKKELIPPPTLCPSCRQQNRFAFRNERCLYHRKCDLTGKQIISIYSADKPYIVYEQNAWWSDQYDPLQYGREFDFSRPFFEQFNELNLAVPKIAIQNANSENSEYTNYSAKNKNCYLVVGGLGAEDCLYGYRIFYSSDCVDCYDLFKCQRCYECIESSDLFQSVGCRNCHNSSDLQFCENCNGCTQCFGCINLRNKSFQVFNEQLTQEEYRARMEEIRLGTFPGLQEKIAALHQKAPHRFATILQCEDSTGDQLLECRNCKNCYTFKHSQDCSECAVGENDRDCRDCNFSDDCELQYFSSNLQDNYHIAFCMLTWYVKDCFYCMNSFNSNHLFGCTGMKKQEYCILNKQYTKEGYEALLPKIIDHMKKTGEWGQFFPASLSAFGYNETIAQEYFPLSQAEVLQKGWKWHHEEVAVANYLGAKVEVPLPIADVSDDITKQILTCDVTKRPYKIIPQELVFYRDMNLPIPHKCPDQRHKERMARANPRRLWSRQCANCQKPIETTYATDRPEVVYCEECYLSTVY